MPGLQGVGSMSAHTEPMQNTDPRNQGYGSRAQEADCALQSNGKYKYGKKEFGLHLEASFFVRNELRTTSFIPMETQKPDEY